MTVNFVIEGHQYLGLTRLIDKTVYLYLHNNH